MMDSDTNFGCLASRWMDRLMVSATTRVLFVMQQFRSQHSKRNTTRSHTTSVARVWSTERFGLNTRGVILAAVIFSLSFSPPLRMCSAHGVSCTTGGEAFGARSTMCWKCGVGYALSELGPSWTGLECYFSPVSGFAHWLPS